MIFSPRRPAAIVLLSGLVASVPAAAEEWRFCVGVSPAAHKAIITDVFASGAESARLEQGLQVFFRERRRENLTFQCPRGGPEKVAALNAQTQALQFDRHMGFSVGGLPAADVVAAVEARD